MGNRNAKAARTEICIRRKCKCKKCPRRLKKMVTLPGMELIDFHEDDESFTATVATVDPKTVLQELELKLKNKSFVVERWLKTSQYTKENVEANRSIQEHQPELQRYKKEFEDRHSEHEHKLELQRYKERFTCHGCWESGIGARYRCKDCDYKLHKNCRFPKPTTSHCILPKLTFDFSDQPPTSRRVCDACANDIYGYYYHCRERDLDLHPCCSKLRPKLCISGMEFQLNEKTSSKCLWCKKKKRNGSDISGWSYISLSDKYRRFHVYCIVEMALEARKNSPSSDADQDVLEALEGMDWGQVVAIANSKRDIGIRKARHVQMGRTIMFFVKTVACVLLGDVTGLVPMAVVVAELVSKFT
ncbi:Protein kinase C [Bertholletia excelsa]